MLFGSDAARTIVTLWPSVKQHLVRTKKFFRKFKQGFSKQFSVWLGSVHCSDSYFLTSWIGVRAGSDVAAVWQRVATFGSPVVPSVPRGRCLSAALGHDMCAILPAPT